MHCPKERNKVILFPETEHILQNLSHKYPLIALSNGNADLSMIGIDNFFAKHYSAESIGKAKPHNAMFNAALAFTKCNAQQALHIGDHATEDINAAQTLGMHTIWFNQNNQQPSSLCQPSSEIHSLATLLEEVNKIHASISSDLGS